MESDSKQFIELLKAAMADHRLCSPPRKAAAPILQRAYASAGAVNALSAEPLTPLQKVEREAMFHAGMMYDTQRTEDVLAQIHLLTRDLEHFNLENPETADQITSLFGSLVRTYGSILRDFMLALGESEKLKMRPLLQINNAKAAALDRAQAIAEDLWEADIFQEIRLGEMAERVYRALVEEGYQEALPGTVETLKSWIRGVAPDYARKPGKPKRRSKTP